METATKVVVLLTGLIGLLSTYYGYKTLTANKKRAKPSRIHALRIRNPAVRTAYQDMNRMKWQLAVPAVLNAGVALWMFLAGLNLAALIPLTIAAMGTTLIFTMRTKPPSRTMRHAEFVFEAPPIEILKQSLVALHTIGAEVGNYDSENGLIEAKDPVKWFSQGGAIITVRVYVDDKQRTCLKIESDAPVASAIFGGGYNARVVQRFGEQLFVPNEQTEKDTTD